MGKRQRQRERNQTVKELRMTVATSPRSALDVRPDIEMVKSALAYADTVTLLSPTAAMLHSARALQLTSGADVFRLMSKVGPVMGVGTDQQHEIDELARRLRRPGVIASQASLVSAELECVIEEIRSTLDEQASASGLDQLDPLIKGGLLRIAPIAGTDPALIIRDCLASARAASDLGSVSEGDRIDVVSMFCDQLEKSLTVDREYLAFDSGTAELTQAAISEGLFKPTDGGLSRNAQAMLGTELVAELPSFPHATLDEVVDVRSRLGVPLVRFRGEVVDMSRQLESRAYEPGFRDEFIDLWRWKVEPALLEITESVREDHSILELSNLAVSSANKSYPGFVILGAGLASQAGPISLTGAALSAGAPLLGAWRDLRRRQKELSTKPMYFLYKLNDQI